MTLQALCHTLQIYSCLLIEIRDWMNFDILTIVYDRLLSIAILAHLRGHFYIMVACMFPHRTFVSTQMYFLSR